MALPILLYGLFALTMLWTVNPDLTQRGLGRMFTLLFVPLLVWTMPKISKESKGFIFEIFTNANCIYALVFLATSFVEYLKTNSLSALTYHDLVSVLERNAIYVSFYFVVSVIYLLNKENRKNWDVIRLIFLSGMILLLSSKMIIVGAVLIFIIHLLFQTGMKRMFKPKILALIGVVVVAFYFLGRQAINRFLIEKNTDVEEVLSSPKFNRVYPWTGTSFRLLQLRIFYEQLQEEEILWTGFGLFASRENLTERHVEFNTYYGYHTYNYHNNYAQVFAESGIFGLLLLLALLFVTFQKGIKTGDLFLGYFALILTMLFLTESLMWVHRGLLFMVMIYSVLHRSSKTSG